MSNDPWYAQADARIERSNLTHEEVVRAIPMVVVALPCSDELCADVMLTALSGGIGYWCCADKIMRVFTNARPGWRYESFLALDTETAENLGTVDYDTIRKGIERILRGQVKCNEHITGWVLQGVQTDAGAIDSATADAIVQAGLLNELRFG